MRNAIKIFNAFKNCKKTTTETSLQKLSACTLIPILAALYTWLTYGLKMHALTLYQWFFSYMLQPEDSFAVAILKSGDIVGHVSREKTWIVLYFIEHNRTVSKRGGRLVVTCRYMFCAKKELISKLHKKLNKHWYVRRLNPQKANWL